MDAIEARRALLALSEPFRDMRGDASIDISKAVMTGAERLCAAADALGGEILMDPCLSQVRRALASLSRLEGILRFRARTDATALAFSISAASRLDAARARLEAD